MTFTVLSDNHVKHLLKTLSPEDVSRVAEALTQALIQYSCNDELQYQPHRAVVTRPTGQVSLFMPATTQQLIGTKMVGIRPDSAAKPADGAPAPPGLASVLTLCDAAGQAIGVLNAAALTAFRTALGSMLLYRLRQNTERIAVFGAGKQALWHVKLAVLLRGADIRAITIVNRSAARTEELIRSVKDDFGVSWPAHITIEAFGGHGDAAALEQLVEEADALFCTVPSTQPLFPAAYLTSEKARSKTRYIAAIGSYRLDMQEIDPEYLQQVVDPAGPLASAGVQGRGGLITVDSRDGCAQEAGELVKAAIPAEQIMEVGQIFGSGAERTVDQDALKKWLASGLVIYKSVGTGVMDLAIGKQLLDLAQAKNVGVGLDEF